MDVEILPVPEKPQKQLAHFYTYEEIMRRYLASREVKVSYCYLNQVKKHLNGFIKFLIANEVGSVYTVTEGTLIKIPEFSLGRIGSNEGYCPGCQKPD